MPSHARACSLRSAVWLIAALFASGCVPLIAPTPIPVGTRGELTLGGGGTFPSDNTGENPIYHAQFAGQRYLKLANNLRIDGGLGASLNFQAGTDVPAPLLGGLLRLGRESEHFYVGGQLDGGLLYAGLGPVVAAGTRGIWLFAQPRFLLLPGFALSSDFFSRPSTAVAGALQFPVGASFDLSERAAFQLMGDWTWLPAENYRPCDDASTDGP